MIRELRVSARLQARGLTNVLCDIVKFMYNGDPFSPPAEAIKDLSILVSNDSALVWEQVGRDKPPVLKVHPWPSWLTRGSPRVVDFFI